MVTRAGRRVPWGRVSSATVNAVTGGRNAGLRLDVEVAQRWLDP